MHYSLTGAKAVETVGLVRPRTTLPVHYEGWSHFRDGRSGLERAFAAAPDDVRDTLRWLPIGEPVDLGA